MVKINLGLIISLIALGCGNRANVEDEIAVLQQTFYKTTVMMAENGWADSKYDIPRFLPNVDTVTYLKKPPNYKQKMGIPIYYIVDTLYNVDRYKFAPTSGDSSKLVQQLLKSKATKINVVFKTDSLNYYLSKRKLRYKENGNYNGEMSFSRVVFNEDKTQACYYVTQYYNIESRGWGMGNFVIAEKRKNGWFVLRIIDDWTA